MNKQLEQLEQLVNKNIMNKLYRAEAICILNEYIETKLTGLKWYQQIKSDIKAIVFYGSTAKGLNKP